MIAISALGIIKPGCRLPQCVDTMIPSKIRGRMRPDSFGRPWYPVDRTLGAVLKAVFEFS
jgi:hypothetical protein